MAKKKFWFEEPQEMEGIEYAACLFCGSKDYDLSDGDVSEVKYSFDDQVITIMRYIPTTCDQCGFGFEKQHKLMLH